METNHSNEPEQSFFENRKKTLSRKRQTPQVNLQWIQEKSMTNDIIWVASLEKRTS